MQSIIISIKPQHVKNIFDGKKTLEIRKSYPRCGVPFRAVVYETKSNGGCGGIVGEFIVDKICEIQEAVEEAYYGYGFNEWNTHALDRACLHPDDMFIYSNGEELLAWQITAKVRYKNIESIKRYGLKRPPQSWQYLKEADHE